MSDVFGVGGGVKSSGTRDCSFSSLCLLSILRDEYCMAIWEVSISLWVLWGVIWRSLRLWTV